VPSVRRRRARHQFQQRGFPGAVDAHHAPALPAADHEVEPVIDDAVAIGLLHPLQAHHILARTRRGEKIERHGLAALRRFDALDLLQLLHPALHLGGMRGARLEALDEFDLLGQHRLLALELGLLLLLVQRALRFVEFVIARIGRERPTVDLDHLVDDAVHELAVVRGHEQRALVSFQELLEPDQAFEVEVVARLVEQHGVGTHQENSRQRHAHLPAAGQRADVAVHHLLAEAETSEHFACPPLQRIAVEFLEAVLHLAVAHDDIVHLVGARGVRHRGLELLQFARNCTDGTGAIYHLGHRAAAGHLADVLAEIADGDAAIDGHLPFVGQFLTRDHPEQRRLARAIGADEADLLALLERGGGLDEENLMADLLADVV